MQTCKISVSARYYMFTWTCRPCRTVGSRQMKRFISCRIYLRDSTYSTSLNPSYLAFYFIFYFLLFLYFFSFRVYSGVCISSSCLSTRPTWYLSQTEFKHEDLYYKSLRKLFSIVFLGIKENIFVFNRNIIIYYMKNLMLL